MRYLRPLLQRGFDRPKDAVNFCDLNYWFTECALYARDGDVCSISAHDLSEDELMRLTHPRVDIQGLVFNKPIIMGILNTTPDSFSDPPTYKVGWAASSGHDFFLDAELVGPNFV